jgi:hypothetical protein
MKSHHIVVCVLTALLAKSVVGAPAEVASDVASATEKEPANESGGGAGPDQKSASRDALDWTVAIYPVLAWLPIFGASVSFPNLPSLPGGGGGVAGNSGTLSGSFNGAALAGFSIQKSHWIVDVGGLWADVSASTTTPKVSISTGAIYGDIFAGRQFYHNLALTGGVRRMALNIHAQLGNLPEMHWKPGVWDPLVGLDWRASLSHKWSFRLDLAGGGFGVGNDLDLSGSSRLDWRFTRHFGLTVGYAVLHFQNSSTVLNQVHKTKQTLDGPIFGFGIYL